MFGGKKMKKIASIFLFALFVISIVPLVSAEEVSDAELTEEIEIMTLEERAEYRLQVLFAAPPGLFAARGSAP